MGCGCKKDKAMVERKLLAKQERKKQYQLRHEQQELEARKAAFDEYLRTRQPIAYQDTAGGRKAIYADFDSSIAKNLSSTPNS